MFNDEHLNDVQKVYHSLRGHWNAGVSYADEKGVCSSIFGICLVCNGISNIIPLPQLEKDGFCVNYDTLKSWVVHIPDETPIFFKQDNSIYGQFPYVYV